ncbi:MAG: ORF6N domain-containing protein [Paludibacteraceae bacterium]|nr:ORF6N domain-containing protein [Paludibacteraceae bacterium]
MEQKSEIVLFEQVENKIITLRGQQVILDSDVAQLYGVETKHINQAVRNNLDKFPKGYVFQLQDAENQYVVKNFDHLSALKYRPQLPTAFTEKGLYMLATILKSPRATKTTLSIIEAFANLRNLTRNVQAVVNTDNKEERKEIMGKTSTILSSLIGDNLKVDSTETEVELDLAILKVRHKFNRK